MNLEYYVFGILLIPFTLINVLLIFNDIKYKKIRNKYLLYLFYLIPYWYLFLIYFNHFSFSTDYFHFFIQIILTFIISFALYTYGLWSAGDAKYLLVLSLFFPHIGIIPFIGNISLITILYLIIYFIGFYFIHIFFLREKTKSLIKYVYIDNKDKFLNYIGYGQKNNTKLIIAVKIGNWLYTFLLFFVILRLLRIYIFDVFIAGKSSQHLYDFVDLYSSYIFFGLIVAFIGSIYFVRYLYFKFVNILTKTTNFVPGKIHFIIKIILSLILFSFIIGEYIINPIDISQKLYVIFTLYLILYFLVMILWYSYKITFQLGEQISINYKQLKKGDIIDKNYLIKNYLISNDFWQAIKEKNQFNSHFEDKLNNISDINYFKSIRNPLGADDVNKINDIVQARNKFYKKQEEQEYYHEIYNLKILKTFAFAGYIFAGFIFTYFYADQVFTYILIHSAEFFYSHF